MNDTLLSVVNGIDKMDSVAYLILLGKLSGALIVGISGILGAFVTIYKSSTFFWDRFISHVSSSMAKQYATPNQLAEAIEDSTARITSTIEAGFAEGEARFAHGDQRMTSIEQRINSLPCLKPMSLPACSH